MESLDAPASQDARTALGSFRGSTLAALPGAQSEGYQYSVA
jgi:hypothetical protein